MSIEPVAVGVIMPEATLEDCEQALHQVERNAAQFPVTPSLCRIGGAA
jgi:hypothetical protein